MMQVDRRGFLLGLAAAGMAAGLPMPTGFPDELKPPDWEDQWNGVYVVMQIENRTTKVARVESYTGGAWPASTIDGVNLQPGDRILIRGY
jgi:hypothetical protein